MSFAALLEQSLPAATALMALLALFAMGLDVSVERLQGALRHRVDLGWGLLCNFVMVPLTALLAANVLGLGAGITLGILVCALSPGGGTGTLLTDRARGDVSISVSLMILCALLSIPLTPLLVTYAAGQLGIAAGENLFLRLLLVFLLFQLLPLFMGMWIRHLHPTRAMQWKPPAAKAAFALLLTVVLGYLWLKGSLLLDGLDVLLACTVISVAAFGVPLAWRYRAEGARRAYMMTTGVRNLSVSLVLVSTVFRDNIEVLFGVLAYGLMMYLVGIPVGEQLRMRSTPAGH